VGTAGIGIGTIGIVLFSALDNSTFWAIRDIEVEY